MGNRRRPTHPTDNIAVDIPIQERTVHKRVPAVVHWATVEGQGRTDDETIGEAIIYEDGTSDVIVFKDISDDAKQLVTIINQSLDNYSIEEG